MSGSRAKAGIAVIAATAFLCTFVLPQPLRAIKTIAEERAQIDPSAGTYIADVMPGGRITARYSGSSGRTVIYIQDLHCQPSVQKNIASLLSYLTTNCRVHKIYVEGASQGLVDCRLLRALPDDAARPGVLSDLMDQGFLGGSEYFAVRNPSADLFGLENETLYNDTVDCLKQTLTGRERSEQTLRSLRGRVRFLVRDGISSDLRSGVRSLFSDSGSSSLHTRAIARLKKLSQRTGEDIRAYPELWRFVRMSELRRAFHPAKVNDEMRDCLRVLRGRVSYSTWQTSMREWQRYPSNQAAILTALRGKGLPDVSRQYPALYAYLSLQTLSRELNPEKLVDQEEVFQQSALLRAARAPKDRHLLFLASMTLLTERFARLSLTPAQCERFLRDREQYAKELHSLSGERDTTDTMRILNDETRMRYYRNNIQRNELFVKTVREADVAPGTTNDVDIVVAGGFHQGIIDGFRAAGIPCVTVMPDIPDAVDSRLYEKVMFRQESPSGVTANAVSPTVGKWRGSSKFGAFLDAFTRNEIKSGCPPGEIGARYARLEEKAGIPTSDRFTVTRHEEENIFIFSHGAQRYVVRPDDQQSFRSGYAESGNDLSRRLASIIPVDWLLKSVVRFPEGARAYAIARAVWVVLLVPLWETVLFGTLAALLLSNVLMPGFFAGNIIIAMPGAAIIMAVVFSLVHPDLYRKGISAQERLDCFKDRFLVGAFSFVPVVLVPGLSGLIAGIVIHAAINAARMAFTEKSHRPETARHTAMAAIMNPINSIGLIFIGVASPISLSVLYANPCLSVPLAIVLINGWILIASCLVGRMISEKEWTQSGTLLHRIQKNANSIVPLFIGIPLVYIGLASVNGFTLTAANLGVKTCIEVLTLGLAATISLTRNREGNNILTRCVNTFRDADSRKVIGRWALTAIYASAYLFPFLYGYFLTGNIDPLFTGNDGVIIKTLIDVGFLNFIINTPVMMTAMELIAHDVPFRTFIYGDDNATRAEMLRHMGRWYTGIVGVSAIYWTVATAVGWALDMAFGAGGNSIVFVFVQGFLFATVWYVILFHYLDSQRPESSVAVPDIVSEDPILYHGMLAAS